MPTDLFPITPPLAEPPRAGSGALLPTLGRLVAGLDGGLPEREVGFAFNPENCGESGTLAEDPCDSTPSTKTIPENLAQVRQQGFYVWAGDKCSPFPAIERDFRAFSLRQLQAALSYQVAHELWTGDRAAADGLTTNRSLASIDSDVLTSVPTSPTDALARLEYGLGDCAHGARGVVHADRITATFWGHLGLLRREGAQLLTFLDTIVVADAGYDGSGPDGQAAVEGSRWAYATGMPIVRLGPERVIPDTMAQAVNRTTNEVEWRAERKAAVGWDGCCHLAVELDLDTANIGGPGS